VRCRKRFTGGGQFASAARIEVAGSACLAGLPGIFLGSVTLLRRHQSE